MNKWSTEITHEDHIFFIDLPKPPSQKSASQVQRLNSRLPSSASPSPVRKADSPSPVRKAASPSPVRKSVSPSPVRKSVSPSSQKVLFWLNSNY